MAGYAAMCSSDYPALFLSPYPTHASGSLLLLQPVSDWLAARHVVLVMCHVLFHVCCCPAMLPCAPLTTLLCCSFALPRTCIYISPDSAVRE